MSRCWCGRLIALMAFIYHPSLFPCSLQCRILAPPVKGGLLPHSWNWAALWIAWSHKRQQMWRWAHSEPRPPEALGAACSLGAQPPLRTRLGQPAGLRNCKNQRGDSPTEYWGHIRQSGPSWLQIHESSQDRLSPSQSSRTTQMAYRFVSKINIYYCEPLRFCGCVCNSMVAIGHWYSRIRIDPDIGHLVTQVSPSLTSSVKFLYSCRLWVFLGLVLDFCNWV